ncbi:MAG: transposase [Acidobacteriales bacterium]|nr:transposase [Terriglobales bacterium]
MSYVCLLVHVVFSTKGRLPLIPSHMEPRLWAFMGGIARKNGFKALAVGGVADHAHTLLSLPATMPLAKAVQLIKAGSSKWMNDQSERRLFAWQETYGAFSIGIAQLPATIRYIQNQQAHHQRRDFSAEWELFLKRHGMEIQKD